MKSLLALFLFFVFQTWGQETDITNSYWCFEENFIDSISENDTLIVPAFYFDNSPIQFKKNGKFRRIAPPVMMCSRRKPTRIRDLNGKWALDNNVLTLDTKQASVSFLIHKKTESAMLLSVLRLSRKE